MTPNRLFHYQTFKEEHLVSLLSEGKLKLSRPDKFNDPWDCRLHYRVPADPAGRDRVIEYWKELHRKHHPYISEARRALLAYEFKSHPLKYQRVWQMQKSVCMKLSATDTAFIVLQRSLMFHSCGRITQVRIPASVSNSTQGAHHFRLQKRSNTYPLIQLTTFLRMITMYLFSPNRRIGRMKPSGG